MQVLTIESLRRIVPSAFATQPYHAMSDRYRFVGTDTVIGVMEGLGFFPVKAAQSRSRIEGKAAYTRHSIRFRHAGHLNPLAVGQETPEIVIENSHDGTAAYRLHAGIWRLVCSNGLLIASASFGTISVKHSGGKDFTSRISDATHEIVSHMPSVFQTIGEWKQIMLPRNRQIELARQAHGLKPNPSIDPIQLLTSHRREDDTAPDGSRSLWHTFNAVEENLIHGGLTGVNSRGRRIRTRPVRAVAADIKINRDLWRMSESFAFHN